jgi:hypothetical protein
VRACEWLRVLFAQQEYKKVSLGGNVLRKDLGDDLEGSNLGEIDK